MSTPETLEEALQQLQDLEGRVSQFESENTKLKATKERLQADLKKKKTVDSFLKVAGIEISPEMSEEEIAQRIVSVRGRSDEQGEQDSIASQPPTRGQNLGPTPQDAMDEALKAQFASLRRELDEIRKEKDQVSKERDAERAKRRGDRLEKMVMDELSRIDCRRPKHLFKLEREKFRLLEDDDTVVYGPEEDPISLKDAIARLREDEEYSVYFAASGATGSGIAPARTTYASANNPFATGSVNATQAAELVNKNPDKARRLMMEARAAGKLDAVMSRAFASL